MGSGEQAGGVTVEQIGRRLASNRIAYRVQRGDELLGRVVDCTPYAPVERGLKAGSYDAEDRWLFSAASPPILGTDPALHAFEAQLYEELSETFDDGPTFHTFADALEWLTG